MKIYLCVEDRKHNSLVNIGDFACDGTVFIQQTERSESYELALSKGESFSVWVTQVFVAIGSYSVPIPGGMGVTDYLMLDGFRGLMSDANAAKLEMLSRGMSFYICVIICGITCAIGYVINKRNGRKGK